MERPKNLGEVLGEVINHLGIQRKLEEARIIEAWYHLADGPIKEVTESVWIDREKLVVKVNSSVWRQELHLQRQAWLERVTRAAGVDFVKEIVFR
jgi:predicted nucleic acid-binding Zn ribbon protein